MKRKPGLAHGRVLIVTALLLLGAAFTLSAQETTLVWVNHSVASGTP